MQFTYLIIILLLFTGCAPVFNEFQGADTVGKGNRQITPYISSSQVKSTNSDDSDLSVSGDINSTIGIRYAYGITNMRDIHLKYDNIDGEGGVVEGFLISLGIKQFIYSEQNNIHRLSFYLPLSYASRSIQNITDLEMDGSGETQTYLLLEPTIIASSKLSNKFDLNYSAKFIQKIAGDDLGDNIKENGIGLNMSIIFPLSEMISLIPEYGILFWDKEQFTHSGIGINLDLNKLNQ